MSPYLDAFGRRAALALLLCGCQDPSITSPDSREPAPDLAEVDGGAAPLLHGTPDDGAVLYAEVGLAAAQRFREWKRDPMYLRAGGQQHLFFAGSMAPPNATERWALARLSVPDGQPLTGAQQGFTLLLSGKDSAWDSGDLLSPSALYGPSAPGGAWAMWYAAGGDPQRPDYVSQIGLATSKDGVLWERRASPVVAAPVFSGSGADGMPQQAGPASHGASDPVVVPVGGTTVWLYYAGLSCQPGCRFQILRAVSNDGVSFRDHQVVWRGRDDVPEEAGGVAGPGVVLKDGQIYLAYTQVREVPQRSRQSIRRAILTGSIAVAVSTDGLHFASASGKRPVWPPGAGFYAGGSSGPSLHVDEGGRLRLMFGGLTDIQDPAFSIGQATLSQN